MIITYKYVYLWMNGEGSWLIFISCFSRSYYPRYFLLRDGRPKEGKKKKKKNLRAKMDNTITKPKNEKPKYTQAVSCHLKKKKRKRKEKKGLDMLAAVPQRCPCFLGLDSGFYYAKGRLRKDSLTIWNFTCQNRRSLSWRSFLFKMIHYLYFIFGNVFVGQLCYWLIRQPLEQPTETIMEALLALV